MSSHGSTHGAKAVSSKAIGMMMTNLLTRLPIAIFADHRQLACGSDSLHVLGGDGRVIDHNAGGLRARFDGGGEDVVHDCEQTDRQCATSVLDLRRAGACRSTSCTLVQHRLVDNRVAFRHTICTSSSATGPRGDCSATGLAARQYVRWATREASGTGDRTCSAADPAAGGFHSLRPNVPVGHAACDAHPGCWPMNRMLLEVCSIG